MVQLKYCYDLKHPHQCLSFWRNFFKFQPENMIPTYTNANEYKPKDNMVGSKATKIVQVRQLSMALLC